MTQAVDAFIARWRDAGGSERQAPDAQTLEQTEADLGEQPAAVAIEAVKANKASWPKAMRDQVAAVRLHLARQPHSAETLARQFKRSPTEKVAAVLDALESLGLVERNEGSYQLLG